MSIEGTPVGIDLLLERLRDVPSGATADEAAELLRRWRRPATPALEQARRVAALPRLLTREVYAHLAANAHAFPSLESPAPAEIEEVLRAFPQDFQPLPRDAWEMRSAVREALLTEWQRSERDWREWNSSLFRYFSAQSDKASELEAVHHGAASASPDATIPYFEQRYAAADARADFAHCHALLEAVRAQERFRGSPFSRAYRDRAKYLQSRLLFLDALQKSGSYLKRQTLHGAFDAVRSRTAPQPWIFHVHATGGLGKTMFLRWSVARDLVPRRIPCAYVDFDDHALLGFVQYPLRLLEIILKQWSQQMTQTVLSSAVELLQQAEKREGWDAEVLARLRVTLQGANLQDEMIVVLDTLEEATLAQPEWLKQCVATLRELHAHLPRLTLVLSGRYDLRAIAGALDEQEAVCVELEPFSRGEAHAYLTLRNIESPEMQAAIVERAVVDELPPLTTARKAVAALARTPAALPLNPFKLALMVELVQGAAGLGVDEVRRLPNVDIAYLIERIILRIPSQPLRWVIRYGAAARRLTRPLLDAVLLPPLRAALRGTIEDLSGAHLNQGVRQYLDSKVAWTPDPVLADSLTSADLWKELATYARERGWVSMVSGRDALQLHPEVVKPVRVLLSEEPVYLTLHAAARDFYGAQWSAGGRLSPAGRAEAACEAIYHETAIDPLRGHVLWRQMLDDAGDQTAYAIALEPTTKTYLDEKDQPLYPDWYTEAHVESAKLELHEAGLVFASAPEALNSFRLHIGAALRTRSDLVPRVFRILAAVAADEAASHAERAQNLARELDSSVDPYEQFWLRVHAAGYCTLAGEHERAISHWTAANDLVPQAGVGTVSRQAIEAVIAELHLARGRYSLGMAAYGRARAKQHAPAQALEREAMWALRHHDLARALPLVSELTALGSDAVSFLKLRQYVEQRDTAAFFAALTEVQRGARDPDVIAQTYLLEGAAFRHQLDFAQALEAFSRAIASPGTRDESAWSKVARVRQVELYAFDMGEAARGRQIASSGDLDLSSEHGARVQIAMALLAARDDPSAASTMIEAIADQPSIAVRCRALLLGAALGLPANGEAFSSRFERSVRGVDPPHALVEVFEVLEHLPRLVQGPAQTYRVIAEAVLPMCQDLPQPPVELPLQWLDVARVWGAPESDVLRDLRVATGAMPHERSAARVWYGLRLLDHYASFNVRPPFSYASLLEQSEACGLAGTPLEALVKSRTSMELAEAGEMDAAHTLADEAFEVWERQPNNRFLAEVSRARMDLIAGRLSGFARQLTAVTQRSGAEQGAGEQEERQPEAAPLAPSVDPSLHLDPQWTDVVLDDDAVAALDRFGGPSVDGLSTALWTDWRAVYDALVATLAPRCEDRPAVRLVTSTRYASLPWEFAVPALWSDLFCRGVQGGARPPAAGGARPRSVLLIKPEESDLAFSVDEAASSGFSLEQLYHQSLDELTLETLVAPDPARLQHTLRSFRPAVVHIVGQVFESPSGVQIDFEGAEARIYRNIKQAEAPRRHSGNALDAHRLIRYLDKQAPLVILDVTAPENIVDIVRMLLLRNRFAAELFESGAVRGVLATGLTAAEEREPLARALLRGLVENTTMAALWGSLREHDEPRSLPQALREHSSALFAHAPFDRVLDADAQQS